MRSLAGSITVLVMTSITFATDEITQFHYWREIDRSAAEEEEIAAFRLDSDIYAATRNGLPDLRIFDDQQAETPYQIEPDMEYFEDSMRETFPLSVDSLREENNTVEIRLRRSKDRPAVEGLIFFTPQRDYERKVRIFGSDDGDLWEPLAVEGILFDYTRYMDVNNREISLPKNPFQQFKVVVEEVTDEKESPYKELTRTLRDNREFQRVERTTVEHRSFRIDRIAAWNTVTRQHAIRNKIAAYSCADFLVEQNAQEKQTILYVRTHREPVSRLTLETPSRNFSRRVVVEIPELRGEKTYWTPIGESRVSTFRFRSFHREQLTVGIPDTRQEEYRLTIDNEDNPPLEIQGVKLEGPMSRVAFLAENSRRYRTFYGSETAKAPKYEAAEVLAALRQGNVQPVMVSLGPSISNPAWKPSSPPSNGLLNNWLFLGATVVLMVAVLTWGLFRAGRRLEEFYKE